MEERIKFVILALRGGQSFSSLCSEFGISRPTGYRWLHRYRQSGSFTSLEDRSHKPKASPHKTPDAIEWKVVALRERDGWGARKLQVKLAEAGIQLSESTINRILRRRGLMRLKDSHQPALRRFERRRPNELWQIDFKSRFKVREGHCYPLSIVDDHSRFGLGLYSLPIFDGKSTYNALLETMKKYGVPKAMLMDHGTPWWNTNSGGGLTWLSVQWIKQGIRLYHGRFRHPQTQGKVEAFHRTLSRAFDHHGRPQTMADSASFFKTFLHTYNYERPHEALDMQVPASRYEPSDVAWDPNPPAWHYAPHLTVVRVDSQGSISFGGRRHFVAKPLANEEVAVQHADGKLLVTYRGTYVREVDLDTGETRPFVAPVHDDHYIHV
jgi:transposase InsO family protein